MNVIEAPAEDHSISTDLDGLTYDELDELGFELTWAIEVAFECGATETVDRLLHEKARVNRMKAGL